MTIDLEYLELGPFSASLFLILFFFSFLIFYRYLLLLLLLLCISFFNVFAPFCFCPCFSHLDSFCIKKNTSVFCSLRKKEKTIIDCIIHFYHLFFILLFVYFAIRHTLHPYPERKKETPMLGILHSFFIFFYFFFISLFSRLCLW